MPGRLAGHRAFVSSLICRLFVPLLAAGCATTPSAAPEPAPPPPAAAPEAVDPVPAPEPGTAAEEAMPETEADAPDPGAPRVVPETWETVRRPEENVHSVAVWPGAGARAWLLATAEGTDRLLVFDAGTGEALREVGARGDGGGQFRRPGGIGVVDDLAFVVERDNGRVQVLRLPGLSSLGFVGVGELASPYALTAARSSEVAGAPGGEASSYELWVSDDHGAVTDPATGPNPAGRVHQYRVRTAGDGLESQLVGTLGDADGSGALHEVATLRVDPRADDGAGRLLVAEEQADRIGLRFYALDGTYGGVVGGFRYGPQGLALYACPDGAGYWLAADQGEEQSIFRVLDRGSLQHLGAFTGEITSNTGGVWLSMVPTPEFPAGAFYAVHDDQSVTAFDWRHVADALGLRADCAMEGK